MPYGRWGFDVGPGASISGRPEFSSLVVSFADGRRINFHPPKASQTGETAYRGPLGTKERLFINRTNQYSATADLWMEDGSHEFFDWQTGLSGNDQYVIDIFTPLYFEDPYGQRTTWTWEQIPGKFNPEDIRVKKVIDASGRFLTYTYDGNYVGQITASNGQWVKYTWTPVGADVSGRQLGRADYSDGTFATYTYQTIPVIDFLGNPSVQTALSTAEDTRAQGPMRSIQYEYTANPQKDFSGEIKAERHFGDGTLVSAFAHNSDRTGSADTRGDGPSRTFYMQKVDNIPLITSKSDFYGRLEYFYYDANSYLRQVKDRRGYLTTYINEPILGRPTTITHPDQSYRAYTYSSTFKPYFVSSVRDELGRYTYYYRDGNNRIYQINFPNGAVETFAYNGFGQVTTHRRTNGVYDAYDHSAYDATGRLIKRWDPTPSAAYPPSDTLPHYTYTYYSSADVWEWEDRISRVTDPLGRVTTYEYDRGSDGVQRAGRGLITGIQYWSDTHDGTLPTGTYQLFGYDIYGNRTSVTDELGHVTRYEYDDYNRVVKVTNPMNQATTTSYALDWSNPYVHTTGSIKYIVSPMNKNIVFDYDSNLRKKDQVVALNTPDEAWTLFEYDEVGNLTKTTDPRFKVTSYGYDNRNRQTSVKNVELNETTLIAYDDVGNKTKETRPDTSFRSWDYDAMNRLWHVYEWRYTDPPTANQTTTYGRDLAGNVRTITDTKGAVYSYDYDLKNLKISETYPVDATGVSRTYFYVYDDAGNLVYLKNPANQYKHIVFDARNRSRHSWWENGVGPDVTRHYDAAGRTTDITTNGGETTLVFGYDDANRQIWEDQTLVGYPTHGIVTPRDPDGNRTKLEMYTNGVINYGSYFDYTQRNQLSHIYWDSGHTPWINYSYDASGNMTKRQDVYAGVNDSVNIPSAYYDALNRPTVWENTWAGDIAFARSHYKYDSDGREVATWRDEEANKGERFVYNPTNQLISAKYKADQVWTENPLYPTRTVSYTMTPDALNRQSVTDNGVVSNYGISSMNQYTTWAGQAPRYDGNFNFSWIGGWSYSYDADNRLTSLTTPGVQHASFLYDGLGRCVRRTIEGVTRVFNYDGWQPIYEWGAPGQFIAWNAYGAGADELLFRGQAGIHLRYHTDRHGNVTALLDDSGAVIEKYSYDVFGQPAITDGNGNGRSQSAYGNRFMFQGREYFPELGLYDFRHRFYDPFIGRFIQTDATGFDAGDMNLFRYCGDDPVDKTDPMGLAAVPHMGYYDQPLFLSDYFRPQTTALAMGVIVPVGSAKEWNETKPELMKDPVMRKIINRLERPDVIVYLVRTNDRLGAGATFDKGYRVFWNPYSAVRGKDGTKLSPAMALGHELDHVHEALTNPSGYITNYKTPDSQYKRAEERRVITKGAEASMLKTFYGEKPRTGYDFFAYPVASPLDR
jgi:RHS repeat-associated protein